MKRRLVVAATLLLLAIDLHSQNTAPDIDAYLVSEMQAQHIPALSFAVVHDGRIVTSGTMGLSNVELNVPANDQTEFAIASVSKTVTASGIMLLAQDGALAIDDPVSKYLAVPESWKAMTIRQLLSHTAGVKDHFDDFPRYARLALDRRLSYTKEQYLKAHIDAPLNFAPGTEWAYSGGGYVILGAIIEKVTGHPYGDFLRDRIFRPLGMDHTHIISVTDIMPNRASGYWYRDGALRNGGFTGQAHMSGPDVGVMTTASDLARWLIAVSAPHLWTVASRDAMWKQAHLSDGRDVAAFPTGHGYGLGWLIGQYGKYEAVGHGGSLVNGFTSSVFYVPAKKFGVIVLTNQYDANPAEISFGIAGRFDPELKPPHERQTQPDRDPAATEREKGFLIALLGNGDFVPFATPGLAKHLSGMTRPPSPLGGPGPALQLVANEDLSAPLARYGDTVVRLAYFKVSSEGEDHWITLYLTASGKIADLAGY